MAQKAPSKLCRRTYFLQSGTAPTVSEMRNELGPELADIIIATLQPSQRTAVQPDRILVCGESAPIAGGSRHDFEQIRDSIHEHILQLGGEISDHVQEYWRERLRTALEAVGTSAGDVEFLRFECRQKVTIAREEERRRYDTLLQEMEETIRRRFWEEKGELHRSYAKARALWAEFVCRKVRKQAKDMLCKMAARYRAQLEQEVTCRMRAEKTRIIAEMEDIVKTAVDQQKRMDERAIQWLVYQYEELLKFVNEYNGCLQAVEITRELCNLHTLAHQSRSTQVSTIIDDDMRSNMINTSSRIPTLDERNVHTFVDIPTCDRLSLGSPLDNSETTTHFLAAIAASAQLEEDGRHFSDENVPKSNEENSKDNSTSGHDEASSIISNLSTLSNDMDGTNLLENKPELDRAREQRETSGLHVAELRKNASIEDQPVVVDERRCPSPVEGTVIGGLTYEQPKYDESIYNQLFEDVSICWQKLDPIEQPTDIDKSEECQRSDRYSSDESMQEGESSIRSQPSYRESYDPMVEISERILPSVECLPIVEDAQQAQFGVLFDLTKSESEIDDVADSFTHRYIRATSEDFELMFPKTNDDDTEQMSD